MLPKHKSSRLLQQKILRVLLLLFSRVWSLRQLGLHHIRPPCPSLYPGACSNSCPSSRWCHPTISPSAVPFSSRPQSFPASGSFPRRQIFTSGGQRTGASASTSVLPVTIQGLFLLGLTGLISLLTPLKRLFQHHSSKASVFQRSVFFMDHSHIHTWLLEKPSLW